MGIDQALATVFGKPHTTGRAYPATDQNDDALSESDKRESARLMRVNHVGEVCAQALYQSQALTARDKATKEKMRQSANEENDHLDWCEQRIKELGGRKSLLNPLWYSGSFAIGALAGWAGDRWNLGFVAETERQVVRHLGDHLDQISPQDARSRAVLEQMKVDENNHAASAVEAGGHTLPPPIKAGMQMISKIMTRTAYWL